MKLLMNVTYIERSQSENIELGDGPQRVFALWSGELPDNAYLLDVTLLAPSLVPGPIAAFSFAPDLAGHWEWVPPPYEEDE